MNEELNKYVDIFIRWDNPIIYALFFVAVILLTSYIFYFHIFIPNQKKHREEKMLTELDASRSMTEKFKALSFKLQEQMEIEQQRLGRELHDSIGQNLLLLKMKVDNNTETPAEMSHLIDHTIKDLKGIIFNLVPKALEDFGLTVAVINLNDQINKSSNLNGRVDVSGTIRDLGKERELYLYRIVQESLNNIIKHSGADEYNIRFLYNDDELKIMTFDDGRGMDPEAVKNGHGNGLFNISERVKHLGGTLKINSSAEEGTLLTIEVPYE